eukprot:366319-Chlamydomonas_euryale.AAC.4
MEPARQATELVMALAFASPLQVPTVITAHGLAQLGLNNQARDEEADVRPGDAAAAAPAASAGPRLVPKAPGQPDVPGAAFRRLAARFLHPFNLETNMSRTTVEKLREMTARPG